MGGFGFWGMWSVMLSVLDGEFGGAREDLFSCAGDAWLVGLVGYPWMVSVIAMV